MFLGLRGGELRIGKIHWMLALLLYSFFSLPSILLALRLLLFLAPFAIPAHAGLTAWDTRLT